MLPNTLGLHWDKPLEYFHNFAPGFLIPQWGDKVSLTSNTEKRFPKLRKFRKSENETLLYTVEL